VLAIGAICLGATAATAKTYCVHTAAELQAALTDAGSSGTASNQDIRSGSRPARSRLRVLRSPSALSAASH